MASISDEVASLPQTALDKLAEIKDQDGDALDQSNKAGVKLGLGTDLFGQLHGRELDELRERAKIDGSLNALRSATSVNAEIMDKQGELGVIKQGALADVIAIRGNPVENIALFEDPNSAIGLIMLGGQTVRDTFSSGAD